MIIDILKDIAPEFAAIGDDKLNRFIGYAELEVSITAFGDLRDMAVAYMAAHMLTIAGRRGVAGATTGMKEGELSYSFASLASKNILETTTYGLSFKGLCRQCIFGPRLGNVS